jgi:hypothetical protein
MDESYGVVRLSWEAPAYRHSVKPFSWYLVMGLIVGVFMLWGYLTDSYTVSFAFLLLGAVYLLVDDAPPPIA